MSKDDNKNVVREFFDAGNRADLSRCVELMADEINWSNHGNTKFSDPFIGKQNLGKKLMPPLFGSLKNGLRTTIDHLIGEGDVVVMQTIGQAETRQGTLHNNEYGMVIDGRDGKIQTVVECADTALVNEVLLPETLISHSNRGL